MVQFVLKILTSGQTYKKKFTRPYKNIHIPWTFSDFISLRPETTKNFTGILCNRSSKTNFKVEEKKRAWFLFFCTKLCRIYLLKFHLPVAWRSVLTNFIIYKLKIVPIKQHLWAAILSSKVTFLCVCVFYTNKNQKNGDCIFITSPLGWCALDLYLTRVTDTSL